MGVVKVWKSNEARASRKKKGRTHCRRERDTRTGRSYLDTHSDGRAAAASTLLSSFLSKTTRPAHPGYKTGTPRHRRYMVQELDVECMATGPYDITAHCHCALTPPGNGTRHDAVRSRPIRGIDLLESGLVQPHDGEGVQVNCPGIYDASSTCTRTDGRVAVRPAAPVAPPLWKPRA